MNITVTKKDIANGKRRSITDCPIALACKRRCKTESVQVDCDYIIVNGARYLPVEDFQSAFDDGGPDAVRPSRFTLEQA